MTNLWHGWQLTLLPVNDTKGLLMPVHTGASLHIGPLPRRKGLALYVEGTTGLRVLAYFKDEAAASVALDFIDRMAKAAGMQ